MFYETSDDYSKLWDLAHDSKIPCYVNYRRNDHLLGYQDIAQAYSRNDVVEIAARGIAYVWAETKDDFVKQCQDRNVKFFVGK